MTDLAGYNFTVTQLFEKQARTTPQQVAILDQSRSLTYEALNQQANRLAHWLREQGIKANQVVGLLLPPSAEFIISILAVIKAGGIYLPLDVQAPHVQITEICEGIHPSLIISDNHFTGRLHEKIFTLNEIHAAITHYSPLDLVVENPYPSSPCYVLYTSGTTRSPKGVIIPHRAIVNLVKTVNYAGVRESEVIAQFSNLAFDASTFEIWSGLLNGGAVAIIPLAARLNYNQLNQFLTQYRVDYLFLTTAFFSKICQIVPYVLDPVKTIFFGGEKASIPAIKQLIAHRTAKGISTVLVNGYGPTETTVFVFRQVIRENSVLMDSIGEPIGNTKFYILDETKALVSEGAVGELYVSGIGLGIGYYNNEMLTQEKFLTNPFDRQEPFKRLYRTGDLVRRLPQGEIQFIGRLDDQIKIRGFRVHLNQIENSLLGFPGITSAAVSFEGRQENNPRLVAYLVLDKRLTKKAISEDIQQYLSQELPEYMLPTQYLKVNELPLTTSGKIDRKRLSSLPGIDLAKPVLNHFENPIEEKLIKVWSSLLHTHCIDPTKSFFELGGHSLLMIEACQRISEELHYPCDITVLLTYTSIRQLAQFFERQLSVEV